MTGFFSGMGYIFRGASLLMQKGIRPFVLVPFLINLLLFSGAMWLASAWFDAWMANLLTGWFAWLEWILWPLFAVSFFVATFYTFTILANLIAAPFNAILAERIEARLHDRPVPPFQGYKSLPGIVARTFRSETTKLWYMAKWALLILIISFIPGVNLVAPFLWLWFAAWMLAIEYADYPMGNHELYFKEELGALKRHRMTALGFGGMLSAMTIIPIVNFFAMPVGVAAATVFWVDKISHDYR